MLGFTALEKRDLELPRSTVSIRIKRALSETFRRNVELRSLELKRASQGIRAADGGNGAGAFGSFWQDKRNTPVVAEFIYSITSKKI